MSPLLLTLFALGVSASYHYYLPGTNFNPLQHLGGNGPYFPGPNVFGISPDPPAGCTVDQAAFVARHGSRYPDPSAYYQWTNLSAKIHSATFKTNASEFQFLSSWKPVLNNPIPQLSELALGGYKELYDMGVQYRWNYNSSFYLENTPYVLWANRYQEGIFRTVDSARLFARGYLGPNATVDGSVYVLNNSDPRSVANSLAPSDLCPSWIQNSTNAVGNWSNIVVPPIVKRINGLFQGNLTFTSSDVLLFPVLCGFETFITGSVSPWCNTFTEIEFLQYEYAIDLNYYYGDGAGTNIGANMMLPFLTQLIQVFVNGPNTSYANGNGTSAFKPNPLIATFTNDGQITQLAAGMGVFDGQPPLPVTYLPADRLFRSSSFVTMRGTIGFERLNCGSQGVFMRTKLNDQVYPVASCQQGPGRSCPLAQYQQLIANKTAAAGDWEVECGIANSSVVPQGQDRTTFLTNLTLPWEYVVKP